MVKADVRRDYYADLGLAPSAESEEIKKQFRKLALKFHPDRNPGREQEFIAKFQAIQAAHEILSDSQQRIKYDTNRLRAGYGKFYGPPRTNTQRKPPPTQASTASARPTPTKPTYSQWNEANRAQTGPSAGAQRYSAHARAGPQQWQKKQDDAQTRADAFKGFSGMRGSNAGSWRPFDPQTGRSPTGTTAGGTPRQQNTPFGAQRPKSAYEFFKDNARTSSSTSPNSAKKKHGFAPGTAGGDEPQARNTSAYTHNRSDRPSSMYFDSVPSPTAKKPPPAPEPPQFPEEFERNRRGYAATSGEKTFFSNSPLGRSESARTPSGSFRASSSRTKPPNHANTSSNGKRRSASPKPDRKKPVYDISSGTSSDESGESENFAPMPKHSSSKGKPKAVPKSRLRPNQKFSDFYRGGDSSTGTGEEPSRSGQNSQRSQPTPTPANTGTRRPRRQPSYVDLTADSDENKGHNSDSAAFPRGSTRPQQPAQDQGSNTRPDSSKKATMPSFAGFESRSSSDANNLHKKFSAEDWRDHLENVDFLGASAYSTRKSPNSKSQTQSNSRNDSAESIPLAGSPSLNPFGPLNESSQSKSQQAPTPFAQAKFSADEWAKQLNNLSWNVPEPSRARQSANTPPLARSPRKQSKTGSKVRPTPQAASVASEAEEAKETVNGHQTPPMPEQPVPTEAEAMDIDDELPPSNSEKKESKNASYPDLNSHAAPGTTSNGTVPPQQNPTTPPPRAENKSNGEAQIPLFNLDNLSKTAPFTNTNSSGIDNLNDVHATLPFESRAKQPTTTNHDIRPRELSLPNPPKRPWAPQLVPMGPNSQVLPLEKWQYYVSAMSTYIHDWNNFNRRMLLHFNTRQEAVETGLSPNWISAVGDSARLDINGDDDDTDSEKKNADYSELDEYLIPGRAKGGFSAYRRGIEDDMLVRKHWDVACEMHRDCIVDLGRLREWIRNGGKVVSFAPRPQYDI
ncbi:Heat shock protein DnaJ N-terminal [Penicillium angulare]|uniref:Heat shock protein DnaJ N-terminal n=1 Tax=Penicillium angulare TaxID=116970 RepID=UPI00253FC228|nr:Heat shock protein DnaJ N-terminal [Penicillium angulare]KAJ5259393.1 Heat shock protein DnaJ N-terminal [Penicillium angulare]